MYRKQHTKGLVIYHRDEGSDSRRIGLLTQEFGLLSVKVQAARQVGSKMRPGVQDFTAGEFSLIHGKSGWRLAGVRVHKNFFSIYGPTSTKTRVMANVLNLVRKLVGEGERDQIIFETMDNFLEFMVLAKEEEVSLLECLILLRVLHHLGYMQAEPELSLPLDSSVINPVFFEQLAPRRVRLTQLINESLKATQLT